MQLEKRAAVITGASSGIGAAVARELDRHGVSLMLTARRDDRLRDLAGELANARWIAGEITDPELPSRLVEGALEAFGCCDIVVNNAGIIETGSIQEVDLERICRMVRINVEAAYRMAYVALRHFRSEGAGHLINISSVLGTKVRPTAGAYAGTKHAIEALSEALRVELSGTAVQVTCIEPGLVLTELHDHMEVHPTESMEVHQPLRPQDVAATVRYVLQQPDHVRIPRLMILPGENKL